MVQGNNVDIGASGSGGVESFAFYPANKTVKVGTTVNFRMSSKSFEAHTATAGPGDPDNEPTSYLGAIAAGLEATGHRSAGHLPERPAGSIASADADVPRQRLLEQRRLGPLEHHAPRCPRATR